MHFIKLSMQFKIAFKITKEEEKENIITKLVFQN